MPRIPVFALILATAAAAIPGPAPAAISEPTIEYRYEAHWGGLRAGDLAIRRGEDGQGYQAVMEMVAQGLARRLGAATFAAEASGSQNGGDLQAERYVTNYATDTSRKQMLMEFDPFTGIGDAIERTFGRSGHEEIGDNVPDEMRVGAIDPLSNVLLLGQRAAQAVAGMGPADFVLKSFDGKRRYDLAATVRGIERVSIRNQSYEAVAVRLVMIPLAGFNRSQMSLWRDAEFSVHLDPATLMPLRIRTENFTAAAVVNVVARCLGTQCY